MGDNIHAPTIAIAVPSGASNTSTAHTNGDAAHKSLFDLMAARDRVMAELSALGSVLGSHKVDMNTPLVTPDGFPRADIDVAQIRTTRAKIVRLRNDYRGYMDRIEKGLHAHHAELAAEAKAKADTDPTLTDVVTGRRPTSTSNSNESNIQVEKQVSPFARVNSVVAGSPADTAGLQVGDLILSFASVDASNHQDLQRVAQAVKDNHGSEILVSVRRAFQDVEIRLTPRSDWGGRGSLGCHLLPV